MFIATLFTIPKIQNQLKRSLTDEWMKKMSHTHAHTEYYSAIKKNESLPSATTWMALMK